MRALLKAGACALAMVAGGPASAYTYMTYTIIGGAYGTRATYVGTDPSTPYRFNTGAGYFALNYIVRTDQYATSTYEACSISLQCSITASGNTLTIHEDISPFHLTKMADLSICLTGPASLPLSGEGYLSVGLGCSSGSWRNATYVADYDYGTITSVGLVKYSSFESSVDFYATYSQYDPRVGGVVMFTPEPATWAMMIAGFGIAGVALRRRRRVRLAAV